MSSLSAVFPAGRYYFGDLCYLNNSGLLCWDEVCDLTIKGNECLEGEFVLADGRRFFMAGTAYGDGNYLLLDQVSEKLADLGVDSGSLGLFPLADGQSCPDGYVFTVESDFIVSVIDGEFCVNGMVCNTDCEEEEEEESWF